MATHLVWGAPSQGKSYISTSIAVHALLEHKKVFTNYPVIYEKPLKINQKIYNAYSKLYNKIISYLPLRCNLFYKAVYKKEILSTYKWQKDYIYAGLNNVVILLDEAYTEFNCHNKLPIDEHTFFATTGHNCNEVYLIAQNYSRINVAIRELANFFVFVHKFSNPLSLLPSKGRKQLTPLFFTVETYISEEDYKYRRINKYAIYERKRHWFNINIAKAYDTQYFKSIEKPLTLQLWSDLVKTPYRPDNIESKEKEDKMKNEFIFD